METGCPLEIYGEAWVKSLSHKRGGFNWFNQHYTTVDPKQWAEKCFEEQVKHMK